jgi:hypothetical protein
VHVALRERVRCAPVRVLRRARDGPRSRASDQAQARSNRSTGMAAAGPRARALGGRDTALAEHRCAFRGGACSGPSRARHHARRCSRSGTRIDARPWSTRLR